MGGASLVIVARFQWTLQEFVAAPIGSQILKNGCECHVIMNISYKRSRVQGTVKIDISLAIKEAIKEMHSVSWPSPLLACR